MTTIHVYLFTEKANTGQIGTVIQPFADMSEALSVVELRRAVLERHSEGLRAFLPVEQHQVDRIQMKVLDYVLDCFKALPINGHVTHVKH